MKERLRFALLVLAATIAVTGCDSSFSFILGPNNEQFLPASVADGASGGNEHFFFLPPVVADPLTNGEFDSTLNPILLLADLSVPESAPLTFSMADSANSESEPIRVDTENEWYQLNLHTKRYSFDETHIYQIQVLVAGTELGHVDIQFLDKANRRKATGEDILTIKNGSTLPIKFRIEVGSVYPVNPNQHTVVEIGEEAVLDIPAGALETETGITAEEVFFEPDDDLGQAGALPGTVYDFGPDGTSFDEPVLLSISYTLPLPNGIEENGLTIFSLHDGVVVEIPSEVDTASKTVTGYIDGFSFFGLKGTEGVDQSIVEFYEGLMLAWQNNDLDGVMSFYSPLFYTDGLDWDGLRDVYGGMFGLGDPSSGLDWNMEIEILEVMETGDEAIVSQHATLRATRQSDGSTYFFHKGDDIDIYLTKESGSWLALGDPYSTWHSIGISGYQDGVSVYYGGGPPISESPIHLEAVQYGFASLWWSTGEPHPLGFPDSMSTALSFIWQPILLLRLPVSVSDTSTLMVSNGNMLDWNGNMSIVATNATVDVGLTAYDNCVVAVTEITGEGQNYLEGTTASPAENAFVTGTRTIWFAQNIGIVKVVYAHVNGSTTTIELLSYTVADNPLGGYAQPYWPLTDGNMWTYEWRNSAPGNEGIVLQETWSIGNVPLPVAYQ